MIKATSKSKKQMLEYLDNFGCCTEAGNDWEWFKPVMKRIIKEIASGELKTVKKVAQELHVYTEEFVLPFMCNEDLY